jgi:hypothetical protein
LTITERKALETRLRLYSWGKAVATGPGKKTQTRKGWELGARI